MHFIDGGHGKVALMGMHTLNARTMTVESSFPLTLNFATLYLGKTESLHFQLMKDSIHYEL
jgi:hypothetical protein